MKEKDSNIRDPDRFVDKINNAVSLKAAQRLEAKNLWISKYDMKTFGMPEEALYFDYVHMWATVRIFGSELIPRGEFSWENPE